MKQHKYASREEYVEEQSKRNKDLVSINWTPWVTDEVISAIVDRLKAGLQMPKFGICHGTRSGREQAELKRLLGCQVIGTEISDTAEQFPDTIQWDFHDVKAEWVGAADFIYSNSLDHSYDPQKALQQWLLCLRPGGVCIIEWSDGHGETHVNSADCFGANTDEMRKFLSSFASVTEVVVKDQHPGHVLFFLEKL